MITLMDYRRLIDLLGTQAKEDIAWAESRCEPSSAEEFAIEASYVICNSGMKHTVARNIFDKCVNALLNGEPVSAVFGHKGKAAAIERIWKNRKTIFAEYLLLTGHEDKLAFLGALPWIGEITKYHLAKNFGVDVAKPDVHLRRLADLEGTTPQALCVRIGRESGHRVATVDTILWRACATGLINSKTGKIRSAS